MNIEKKIRSYVQEGEIYQDQALFDEARKRYVQAADLIKNSPALKNKERLGGIVSKKINSLNYAYAMFQRIETSAKMSKKEQDHILKQLLSSDRTRSGNAELEWAGALLNFGEFEMALNEFNKLLIREPALRVTAAKNILKCHTKLSSLDMAKTQFELWTSGDLFTSAQLKRLKDYLENSIDPPKKDAPIPLADNGMRSEEDHPPIKDPLPPEKHPSDRIETKHRQETLPKARTLDDIITLSARIPDEVVAEVLSERKGNNQIGTPPPETGIENDTDDGPYHILSMDIPLTDSINEIGLEVNYQRGDQIRGIVSRKDTVLLPRLKIGRRLEDVRFYSSYTMVVGACIVTQKEKRHSGPHKGNYVLHIKVVNPYEGE